MKFDKIFGATERQDGLYKIGRSKYEARFGFGKDEKTGAGYDYRKQYKYKPEVDELKDEIFELVNEEVDKTILSGYEYDGKRVWLSTENQFNYKAAYDLAVQTGGASLPVTLKLGTLEEPEYVTFEDVETFSAFYIGAIKFIQKVLEEGWNEKDKVDWTKFECDE